MRQLRIAAFAALVSSFCIARSTQAGIISTVEGPTVQSSSAVNITTIDFDSVTTGYKGSQTFSLPGSLSATYSGTQFVVAADQYGGAGGVGNYLAIQSGGLVTLSLSAPQAYFGLWISAADANNQIEFFNGVQSVGSFSGAGPEISLLPTSYYGNPNTQFLGQNGTEAYVFVNFYAQNSSDMFDSIVLSNAVGATSFESDNHTFSTTLQAPGSVPEPSSLVLFGIAGLIGLAAGKVRFKKTLSV